MPTDGPTSPPGALPRAIAPLGLAAAAVLFMLGTAMVFRTQLAGYLIANALRDAGLSSVALTITRAGASGLSIENLEAENGALRVGRIDAGYSIPGLLASRLDSLTVEGLHAAITWDASGARLGAFRRRPDSGPLDLPHIGAFRASDVVLQIDTPAARLRAPISVSAHPAGSGWDASVDGVLEGPGANVAVTWSGVIVPTDLSQSSGKGRFDVAIDDFLLPDTGGLLDARGLLTLDAANGIFAVSVARPLTLSSAPAAGAASSGLIRGWGDLPWSLTVAPSQSDAALVLTAAGERRTVRFDLEARGAAGEGEVDLAVAGEAARAPQALEFRLAKGRAEVRRLPLAGGHVSGHFTLSEFGGDLVSAKGRFDAAGTAAGVALGETTLGRADTALSGAVSLSDGKVRIDFETLRLGVADGAAGDWTLAAPAALSLAGPPGAHHVTIGALGLGSSAEIALALPEVALRSRGDETARVVIRAPDVRLAALTRGLSLGASLSSTNVSLSHPAAEMREGRLDLKLDGDELSGAASARLVRLGPAAEEDAARGALVTAATLATRGDDLVVRGSFSTAAGAKLGEYSARFSPDFERGTATASMPVARFGPGGKFDASELDFISPVSILAGSIGFDAKRAWSGGRATDSVRATLEDVSLAYGEVGVSGLTTTLDLSALAPPRSAGVQRLAAESITARLPLSRLAAEYTLPGDGTAVVARGSLEAAGGRITLDDAVIPLGGREGAFTLGVEKIDMERLAAQAKVDGLAVTGTLTGSIPLRRSESGYHFAEGVLRADAPGRLVYKPSAPSPALSENQGGALLLQALSNFAYDRLAITIDGPVNGEVSLRVAIAGKNPDLYGGYPIEFNLNLSGRLTEILRQGLAGAGIPADLERQLRSAKPPG